MGDRAFGRRRFVGPPHGLAPSAAERLRAKMEHLVVKMLFPRRSHDLYGGFAETASLHPAEPHWYLAFIGIEPDRQGQGLGEKLLAPVLKTADHRILCITWRLLSLRRINSTSVSALRLRLKRGRFGAPRRFGQWCAALKLSPRPGFKNERGSNH